LAAIELALKQTSDGDFCPLRVPHLSKGWERRRQG
jgi:hypothetical protein